MRSVENSESTISTVMRVWRICCSSERCTLNLYKRTYACDTCLTAQPHTVPLVQPPTLALPNAEAEARPEETEYYERFVGSRFSPFLSTPSGACTPVGGRFVVFARVSFVLSPSFLHGGRAIGPSLAPFASVAVSLPHRLRG